MPRDFIHRARLIALIAAFPLAAQGAGPPQPVDELLVTGSRATDGVQADRLGSSVTVITAQDFIDRQVRVVSDVLRDIPGVAVGRNGAVGNQTQVRVRGTEGNHVLTMIDGIKASDPFFGEFDFATLLADDVARVEVLRGQQSAIYGSDAIGGVINYITPTGRQSPGASLRAEVGAMGTHDGSARIGGYKEGLDYVLSSGLRSTDGYVVAPGGKRNIGSDLGSLAAKLAYEAMPNLRLRAVARYTSTRADTNGQSFSPPGYATDSPGSTTEAASAYGFLGADYDLLDGRWTHSLSVQGVDATRDNQSNFALTGGDKGTRLKASYATTVRIDSGGVTQTLTGAYDYERETYQNTNPPGPFNADTTKRAVRDDGLVGEYNLSAGESGGVGAAVRYDKNDLFRNATTWRLQGYYRVSQSLRLRAAAGSGIKNPSQTELFGYNAAAFPFVGNPNLKPEKSEGWETGADLTLAENRVRLGATYFDSVLMDEIYTDFAAAVSLCTRAAFPVPFSCSTARNRASKSTQKGVELSAGVRLSDAVSLDAAYTHLEARENHVQEIRRPPNLASANLTWHAPADRGSATLTLRYNGDMNDTDFSAFPARTVTLPAFTLVNLAGAWKLTEHAEVFARAENLTDANYREVYGYNAVGRAVYAGVRTKF